MKKIFEIRNKRCKSQSILLIKKCVTENIDKYKSYACTKCK